MTYSETSDRFFVSWYNGIYENRDLLSFFGYIFNMRVNLNGGSQNLYSINIYDTDNGNKLVARATLLMDPKPYHNNKFCGHVEDVVVDEGYRGTGLGKRLMEEIKSAAKKFNCYKLILTCSQANVKFYEKCGFFEHEVSMRCNLC